MEARNRYLPEWFTRIRTRQIALPRFQRMEAWGPNEVAGLLTTVLRGLPAGASLILEVGDSMPFISRPMIDAPEDGERITELLLDGQQRLTALWRSLNNNYSDRSYLVYYEDDPHIPGNKLPVVYGQPRWYRKGKKYPIWVDNPKEVWSRGNTPMFLLKPDDIQTEIDKWIDEIAGEDLKLAREIDRLLMSLREKVKSFNLPFLSLPPATPKDVALDVFIKMNTSSISLTTFDVLVAQLEAAAGESLHSMVQTLLAEAPLITDYKTPENLVLDIAALLQDRVPSQSGYWGIDLQKMVDTWDTLICGVKGLITFLENERIFDSKRLPTDAVLAVIAALWNELPQSPDELGNAKIVLRKYLWRSFFTNRYEQSAATAALNDFRALKAVFSGKTAEDSIPILNDNDHPLPTAEQLVAVGWPKNRIILARGILALSLRCGGHDIADDSPATRTHVRQREYHHLFPVSLLESAEIGNERISCALNCALITWRTNRKISDKDPLTYLKERANANTLGEDDLRRRLWSHLIPYQELSSGNYHQDNIETRKLRIKQDYENFIFKRAELFEKAIRNICSGREININDIFHE